MRVIAQVREIDVCFFHWLGVSSGEMCRVRVFARVRVQGVMRSALIVSESLV